jgi:arginine/lysine/ornithine decarboxylase
MKMNKHMKLPLYNALAEHARKKPISFHVPGHKYGHVMDTRKDYFFHNIMMLDATELTGLDDLHSPEGAILEAQALLAELYQADKSYFLINGSTVGNLAMIMTVCSEDDIVLVQRNCHKSVLNALRLAKARPVFLEPEYNEEWKVAGGVRTETVKEALSRYPEAKAVVLTYPNYYGMVNDIDATVEDAHQHNIPVLVDEAHGAHLIIGSPFPSSAIYAGADIVVQSAHKTLPAMTMGSFLHVNSTLIDVDKLEDYLAIFQSSSPSYPIMASLDMARAYLADYNKNDLAYLLSEINAFKKELAEISRIKVLEFPMGKGDYLKITIQTQCDLSGFELQKRFEEYGIYTELADPYNVLFVLPLLKAGQTYPFAETAAKIKQALKAVTSNNKVSHVDLSTEGKISGLALGYKDMDKLVIEETALEATLSRICAETIIPYPPGIPLLLKGEQITAEKLGQLQLLLATGAKFQGGTILKQGLLKVFRTT